GNVSLVDSGNATLLGGGSVQSIAGAGGATGAIGISADVLLVRAGSSISSIPAGDAGAIDVAARPLTIDGTGTPLARGLTGIFSQPPIASGHSSDINVSAGGMLSIIGPAAIASVTAPGGLAGRINVAAGDLSMRGGAVIGSAGAVQSGDLSLTVTG